MCAASRARDRSALSLRGAPDSLESLGVGVRPALSLSCIGPPLSPRVVPLWGYHAGCELNRAGPQRAAEDCSRRTGGVPRCTRPRREEEKVGIGGASFLTAPKTTDPNLRMDHHGYEEVERTADALAERLA